MLGLKLKLIQDLGAYHQLLTPAIPTLSVLMMPGLYRFKNVSRGRGRRVHELRADRRVSRRGPPGSDARHRTHGGHAGAPELKMDPAEIRLKNFVQQRRVPVSHRDRADLRQRRLRASRCTRRWPRSDYPQLRQEQAAARAEGRLMGIGISTYGEICALGPSIALPAGGWESRHGEDRALGQGHRDDRRVAARAGRGDDLRADRGRRTRRRHGRRAGGARRYRRGAVRHRHVRQPRHGGRRLGAVLRAAGTEGEDEEVRRHAAGDREGELLRRPLRR